MSLEFTRVQKYVGVLRFAAGNRLVEKFERTVSTVGGSKDRVVR